MIRRRPTSLAPDDRGLEDGRGRRERHVRRSSRRTRSLFDAIAKPSSNEGAVGETRRQAAVLHQGRQLTAAVRRRRSSRTGSSRASCWSRSSRLRVARHPVHALPARDADWAAKLKADIDAGTTSFADAARDNSDNAEAANGGDIGWVTKGLQPEEVEKAIFAAPIGKVSDPLVVAGDGTYIFLVDQEEARTPDAEQAGDAQGDGVPELVLHPEGRVRHHPGPRDHRLRDELTQVESRRTMLDALLAEARLRWRLDPAAGLAVVVAERLVATPIEPSLPVVVVPAARMRLALGRARPRRRPCPGVTARTARTPWRSCGRLYPADHPVGPVRRAGRDDDRRADGRGPGRARCTWRPWRPSRTPRRPGACPGSRTASVRRTAARGTASRPTSRCATTSWRRRTRSTTRWSTAPRRSWPASWATCCSRWCSTRSWPPRPASST